MFCMSRANVFQTRELPYRPARFYQRTHVIILHKLLFCDFFKMQCFMFIVTLCHMLSHFYCRMLCHRFCVMFVRRIRKFEIFADMARIRVPQSNHAGVCVYWLGKYRDLHPKASLCWSLDKMFLAVWCVWCYLMCRCYWSTWIPTVLSSVAASVPATVMTP